MTPPLPSRVHCALEEIDQATGRFQAATGLRCPDGCGKCCLSPNVETTVLEMLPIADELFRRGQGEFWHDRVSRIAGIECCVFYRAEPDYPARGSCGIYPWRPSICRLFGFAGGRGKDGAPRLAACAVHRKFDPQRVADAESGVADGSIPLPVFSDFSARIAGLAPDRGTDRYPINDALRRALDHAGLARQIAGSSDAGPHGRRV